MISDMPERATGKNVPSAFVIKVVVKLIPAIYLISRSAKAHGMSHNDRNIFKCHAMDF